MSAHAVDYHDQCAAWRLRRRQIVAYAAAFGKTATAHHFGISLARACIIVAKESAHAAPRPERRRLPPDQIPCPKCFAAAFCRCVTVSGKATGWHADRVRRAIHVAEY